MALATNGIQEVARSIRVSSTTKSKRKPGPLVSCVHQVAGIVGGARRGERWVFHRQPSLLLQLRCKRAGNAKLSGHRFARSKYAYIEPRHLHKKDETAQVGAIHGQAGEIVRLRQQFRLDS
jgi:hypothetical protein